MLHVLQPSETPGEPSPRALWRLQAPGAHFRVEQHVVERLRTRPRKKLVLVVDAARLRPGTPPTSPCFFVVELPADAADHFTDGGWGPRIVCVWSSHPIPCEALRCRLNRDQQSKNKQVHPRQQDGLEQRWLEPKWLLCASLEGL